MSGPVRIQLSRKRGWRMPGNTLKVDRTTVFGNPFPVAKGTSTTMGVTSEIWSIGTWEGPAMWFKGSKPEAVELSVNAFRAWIIHPAQASLLNKARTSLSGKNLGCWCKVGDPCHADVWIELANAPNPIEGKARP